MPKYKLTYFDITAKGESLRMLFKVAGVEFEDYRVSFGDWKTAPPTTPFGQLPMLEIDGTTLCQTRAIGRFLAKKFDLYASKDIEQAQIDMILDCLADMRSPLEKIVWAEESTKPASRTEYEEKAKTMLAGLQKMMLTDGYFIGGKLSWADIEFFNVVAFSKVAAGLDLVPVLKNYPKLEAVLKNVESNPKIADWLKNRPKTIF